MIKKLLLLTLLCCTAMSAQNFWTEVGNIFPDPGYFAGEISIVDADNVWINGRGSQDGIPNNNYMWSKSEDGGITWTYGYYNIPNSAVGSIKAISATAAYITTYGINENGTNGVWFTSDAGSTWTQQDTAVFDNIGSFANSVYFWNANEGLVIGDPVNNSFEIYTTVNGGTNWEPVATAAIPSPISTEYAYVLNYDVKVNTVWFGTNMGRIFKSNDKGLTWSVSQSPLQDFGGANNGGNFTFKNENEGLLVSRGFEQWRTTDAGVTWTAEIPSGAIRNFHTESVPQTNNTYFQFGEDAQNAERGSSYSTDGGQHWIDLNTETDPVYPFSVKFQSGTVGFCIGYYINNPTENGVFQTKFFRLTDPLNRLVGTLGVRAFDKNQIAATPNPTSGLIHITAAEITNITVLDVTGKILLSKAYSPVDGINADFSRFNNGVYFARLDNVRGESQTIRIVKN